MTSVGTVHFCKPFSELSQALPSLQRLKHSVTWALHFNYPPVFLWCLPIASQRQSSVQCMTIPVKTCEYRNVRCVLSSERRLTLRTITCLIFIIFSHNLHALYIVTEHCWPVYLKKDCSIKSQIAPRRSPDALETKVSCHCRSKPRSLGRPACSLVTIPVEHVMNCSGSL